MELINEEQTEPPTDSDFQLTVEVITDVATFSEVTSETTPEVAEPGTEEARLAELDLFAFAPAEILPEELGIPPSSELTQLEQQTIDAMLTGDFDPFSSIYATPDGINMEVWWGASQLYNNLVYNGIAPENFEAVATEWFSA